MNYRTLFLSYIFFLIFVPKLFSLDIEEQLVQYEKRITRPTKELKEEVLAFYNSLNDLDAYEHLVYYERVAILLKRVKEYELCDVFLRKGIDLATEADQPKIVLDLYINLADLMRWKKDYKAAEKLLDESLPLLNKVKDSSIAVEFYSSRGTVYKNMRKFDKSIEAQNLALDIVNKSSDNPDKGRVYKNLSLTYRIMSEHEKSLYYSMLSLDIFEKLDNKEEMALAYDRLATAHERLGSYYEAINNSEHCLEIARALNHELIESKALAQLMTVYRKLSYLDKALEYGLELLRVNEKVQSPRSKASASLQLGLIYERLENYDLAKEYYEQSLAIGKKEGFVKYQASAYKNMASSFEKQNRMYEALAQIKLATELYADLSDYIGLGSSQNKLGTILEGMGRNEEARAYYLRAIESYERASNPWGVANTSICLGSLLFKMGDSDDAIIYLNKGLRQAEQIEANSIMLDAYFVLSRYYESQSRYDKAYYYNNEYIVLRENINSQEVQSRISSLLTVGKIEAKQREIDLLQAEKQIKDLQLEKTRAENLILVNSQEIQDLTIDREKSLRRFMTGIIFMTVLLFIVLLSRFMYARKTQKILAEKNEQIELKNQQLEILNSDKDRLFSIVAHDLRNAFGNLMSALELLEKKRTQYSEKVVDALISEIAASSKNTYGLLENLLEWSKIQMNKLNMDAQVIQMNPFVQELIQPLLPEMQKKEIELTVRIEGELSAFCDPYMISTVIRNLLYNAIKFTPRFGDIILRVYQEQNKVYVHVIDSGIGMDEFKQKALFSIDNIGPSTGTEGEKGTGLGLLLCSELMQLNGGNIKVRSEKGVGSDFSFSIPHKRI